MSYWKSKVLPKLKKFFDKGKKKGASEVCKTFDKSKESLDKEIEEKTPDLNPKVVEIYRSTSTFISKKLLKEPNEASVKENPDAVQSVLQELVKAGFPGAQVICDAGAKFGPNLLPGPVVYLFEKASVYLVEEPLPEEPKEETREVKVEDVKGAAAEGEGAEAPAAAAEEEEEEEAEKIEEAKKEEEAAAAEDKEVASTDPIPATEETPAYVVEKLAEEGVAIASEPPPPEQAAVSPAPPPAEKTD